MNEGRREGERSYATRTTSEEGSKSEESERFEEWSDGMGSECRPLAHIAECEQEIREITQQKWRIRCDRSPGTRPKQQQESNGLISTNDVSVTRFTRMKTSHKKEGVVKNCTSMVEYSLESVQSMNERIFFLR
jgi:hypothetical protein